MAQENLDKKCGMSNAEYGYLLNRINHSNSFFKNMLSTMAGVFLAFVIMGGFLFFNLITLILSNAEGSTSIKDNSVFVLNIQGEITEKGGGDNILGALTGDEMNTVGLNDVLESIEKAKDNSDIKGIYLETGLIEADYATLQEIRNKLEDFRKSGKWIITYADQYIQSGYYLASVANKVYLNPQGILDWHGIAAEPVYYKDLMAKFGIRYNVVKVGKFKSATEVFTEDHMSDANREQVSKYIGGIWNNVTEAVSKSRGISVAKLNEYADSVTFVEDPNVLLQRKMVDGLLYADQVKDQVKKQLGIDKDEAINQVLLSDMIDQDNGSSFGSDEIAVYYCEGNIVQDATVGLATGNETSIVATKVVADLKKLADDEDVKAVVIRINSGGGDAYASEQLWRAISLLKSKKPVVISMGGLAASGGYYMSCNANWIVSQPTTLTGSIGIFGAFPDFSGLLTEKLGVKFDEVKTNKNSSFSPVGYSRPLSADEIAMLQKYINRGYATFLKRVADGRKKTTAQINEIAQGRVWLGQDAIKIGLVDQIGGLDDAVRKAAQLAKIKDYYTQDYPEISGLLSQLMDATEHKSILDEQMRQTLGVYYAPMQFMRTLSQQSPVQARMPYELNIK